MSGKRAALVESDDYVDVAQKGHASKKARVPDNRAGRRLPVEVLSVLWLGKEGMDSDSRKKAMRSKIKEFAWDVSKILLNDSELDYEGEIAEHIIGMMNWRADLGNARDKDRILREHWDLNVRGEVKDVLLNRRNSKQTDLMKRIKGKWAVWLCPLVFF